MSNTARPLSSHATTSPSIRHDRSLRWFTASTVKGVPVDPVVAPARDQPDAPRSSLLRQFGIAKCHHDRPSSQASIPRALRRPQMARSLATSCSLTEHRQGRRGCGPSLPDATKAALPHTAAGRGRCSAGIRWHVEPGMKRTCRKRTHSVRRCALHTPDSGAVLVSPLTN